MVSELVYHILSIISILNLSTCGKNDTFPKNILFSITVYDEETKSMITIREYSDSSKIEIQASSSLEYDILERMSRPGKFTFELTEEQFLNWFYPKEHFPYE